MPEEAEAMKKYFAFCGNTYYPSAGLGDLIGIFDDLSSAHASIGTVYYPAEWWEIWEVDGDVFKKVSEEPGW